MAKYSSAETEIAVSTDGGATYTDLGCQISGFTGPGGSKPEIDVTTLCSTAKEFIGDLPDYGSVEMQGFFDPADAGVALLKALNDSGDTADWRITWPDSGTTEWAFEGYVSTFSVSAGAGQALQLTASVRVSGAITET